MLIQQEKSIINNNEICQNLVKEISVTRIRIEEIETVVNNSSEKLSLKNEQMENTRGQIKELVDKTLPILDTTKTLLDEINLEDLTELK